MKENRLIMNIELEIDGKTYYTRTSAVQAIKSNNPPESAVKSYSYDPLFWGTKDKRIIDAYYLKITNIGFIFDGEAIKFTY